jgi:hypothetical protein
MLALEVYATKTSRLSSLEASKDEKIAIVRRYLLPLLML